MKRVPQAQTEPSGFNWAQIIGHVLNSTATLVAAFFLFSGTQSSNEADMLRTAFNQIGAQGKVITELRTELVRTQLRIIDLEANLRVNVNKAELLQSYLNYLPFPAWVKRQNEDGAFVMEMINEAYTAEFKITPSQYVGKSDFDVHPRDLAEKYEQHDRVVINTNGFLRTTEEVSTGNGRIKIEVFKFAIPMADGSVGVGGVAISEKVF